MTLNKCPDCGSHKVGEDTEHGFHHFFCGSMFDTSEGDTERCFDRGIRCMGLELKKLREFKGYVHKRLDDAGVPPEVPSSPHTAAGCRIGGRLDWVLDCLKN